MYVVAVTQSKANVWLSHCKMHEMLPLPQSNDIPAKQSPAGFPSGVYQVR